MDHDENGFDLSDLLQAIDDNSLSPFTMSEDEISDLVIHSHVDVDADAEEATFNSRYLFFNIVQNTLKTSTQIVQQLVQGQQIRHVENNEEQLKSNSFNLPFILLKRIGREFSCASTAIEDLETEQNKIAFSILNILTYYPFESKATLALAAFAMEYGLFCHFVQLHKSNRLTNSLAILYGMPNHYKPREWRRHQQALLELNDLVIVTMQLINKMIEVGDLAFSPNNVYWAIVMVVVCATNFNMLHESYDFRRMSQDLSLYVQKVYDIINNLQMGKGEARTYNKLKKLSQSRKMITEGFKELIFHDRNNDQYLLDGLTNKRVNVDALWSSMVFVFVSNLNISYEEISLVTSKCESYGEDEDYPIVWIPIVKDWNNKTKQKFEKMRSQIQWYIVPNFTSKVGIRFIEQEWRFKNNSSMLLMIKQLGMVKCIYKKPATHFTYGYASQRSPSCGTGYRKQDSSFELASRRKLDCRRRRDQDSYYGFASPTMFDGFQEKDDTVEMDYESAKYNRIGFQEKEDEVKMDYKSARYNRMGFRVKDDEDEMGDESTKYDRIGFQEKEDEEDSNDDKKIPYSETKRKGKSSYRHTSSTSNDRTGFQEKEDEEESDDDNAKYDRSGFQEKGDEDDSNDDKKIPYYGTNRKGKSSSRHASSIDRNGFQEKSDYENIKYGRSVFQEKDNEEESDYENTTYDRTKFQEKDDEEDKTYKRKVPQYHKTNIKGKSSSRPASSKISGRTRLGEKRQ